MAENQESRPSLAEVILAYFLRNPEAIDSLEGIARWRLQEERIRREVNNAGEALEWLVEQGFLEQISSPVAETVYRLNKAKRSEAQRFLRQRGSGAGASEQR